MAFDYLEMVSKENLSLADIIDKYDDTETALVYIYRDLFYTNYSSCKASVPVTPPSKPILKSPSFSCYRDNKRRDSASSIFASLSK